jgi:threonine/homoserine/homoserine lactone efflux protein
MIEEYDQQRKKQVSRMRSITDYVMGILFISIGIYFLIYEKLGINIFRREPSPVDYLIGSLFIVYGGWRLYRGYKKNYFRNDEV